MTKPENSPASIASRSLQHHARTGSRCGTPRCGGRVRPGVFGRCPRCVRLKRELGSYTALHIKRTEYATEWSLSNRLIHEQRSHPAIVSGLRFIQDWLDAARRGERVPGGKAVQRLADRNPTPEQILTEVLAVELRRKRHPSPTTDAPYLHANAMLRAFTGKPRGKDVKGGTKKQVQAPYTPAADRAAIQKTLFERFKRVFVRMHEYFDGMEQLRNAQILAASNVDTAFPLLCERCSYNERKRLERKRVREGGESRLTKDGKVDGRTRDGLRAAGKHINEKLKIKQKEVPPNASEETTNK